MQPQYRESERDRSGRRMGQDYNRAGRNWQDREREDRASHESHSWFGDEDAERRRRDEEWRFGRWEGHDDDRYGQRGYRPERGDYEERRQDWAGTGGSFGRSSGQQGHGAWESDRRGSQYGSSQAGQYGQSGQYGSSFGSLQSDPYSSSPSGQYGRYGSSQPSSAWSSEGPYVGRGPQGYKRSDERIAEDVNECLTRHGRIDATQIQVSVREGEVTLAGSVNSREEKRLAEDAVEACYGVKEVHNQLRVNRGEQSEWGQQGQYQAGQQTQSGQLTSEKQEQRRATATK